MKENKFWIDSFGTVIDLRSTKVSEHFKYFNDTKEGREIRNSWGINNELTPSDLRLVLEKGWIRGLVIFDTLNLSYMGDPLTKRPVSSRARNELFDMLRDVDNVQFDLFYPTGGSKSFYVTVKDFLSLIETSATKRLATKILIENYKRK